MTWLPDGTRKMLWLIIADLFEIQSAMKWEVVHVADAVYDWVFVRFH